MDQAALMDTQLEHAVDTTPTVEGFSPDDAVAQALISDLASKMDNNSTIAARYGLTMNQLYSWVSIPEVRRRIKTKRAIWESNDNLTERNRAYFGTVTLEAAPVLDRLIHNTTTPPGHIIKALEVAGRLGGVDFKPNQTVEGGASIGSQFSVVIQFSGGKVETIDLPGGGSGNAPPPTIEGEASP